MSLRISQENNEWYPLPRDYPELTIEGQRLARLNAVCLQETPRDLVHAWAFFREYYLKPPESRWYKRWMKSPPMHYNMIWDMGQWSRNIYAAPREFSKTTVVREAIMLMALTRPNFSVSLIQATIKKYRKSIELIKQQLEHNQRIHRDFEPYFGEPLKPKRGARPWGSEILWLPFASVIEGGSVQGAIRGDRPDFMVIDDPEYDDDDRAKEPVLLLEEFDRVVFKTLLPALAQGCGMFWIGTLISRQAFIYKALRGDDARFRYFNRRLIPIEDRDGVPTWSEKWNKQTIADLKLERGESAFNSEYMNNPGSATSRILRLHDEFGVYRTEGTPYRLPNPLESDDEIIYKKKITRGDEITVVEERKRFGEWVRQLYRMITVDYIRKPSQHSDFACIGVWGFDHEDVLWVLDLYLKKKTGAPFLQEIFKMAYKWQVRIIGTEAVSIQESVARETEEFIKQLAISSGFRPRVLPIKYAKRRLRNTDAPNVISKAERIAAMEPRFCRNQIRIPIDRNREFGIGTLITQIANFTLDLSLLPHDDAIDTLAMHQYVPRRKGLNRPDQVPTRDINELLKQGDLVDPDLGIPYALGVNLSNITCDALNQVRRESAKEAEDQQKDIGDYQWPTGPIRFQDVC